jgi:hypothetical protein
MKWKKIKHLFASNNEYPWMYSHASNPFVEVLPNNKWMIYFSPRNKENQSHISALIISPKDNFKVETICPRPLVSPGELGLFDDSGTTMGCLLEIKNQKYLYYLGWNLKVTVPWLNAIGLAISTSTSNDGFPIFQKYSLAPILDRSNEDPFSISYPFILYENGIYRMWYGSNLSWGKSGKDMKYVFKYAESLDGVHWKRTNQIVLNHIYENEYAIARPCILKDKNIYRMWYTYRGKNNIKTYRIGYAESLDGINWVRKDEEVGIDVSSSGWDSEMICYPYVFEYNGNLYMLYNGNGYGKTGIGLAILEQD